MAICANCKQDMLTAMTCILVPFADAPDAMPIRYGAEPGLRESWEDGTIPERCHDCGVRIGGYHHQFCDMERHPVTGAQAIDCERLTVQ